MQRSRGDERTAGEPADKPKSGVMAAGEECFQGAVGSRVKAAGDPKESLFVFDPIWLLGPWKEQSLGRSGVRRGLQGHFLVTTSWHRSHWKYQFFKTE